MQIEQTFLLSISYRRGFMRIYFYASLLRLYTQAFQPFLAKQKKGNRS